jgi:hypothetical protein
LLLLLLLLLRIWRAAWCCRFWCCCRLWCLRRLCLQLCNLLHQLLLRLPCSLVQT